MVSLVPGCRTPPAIVPNITRWVSRSLIGRPLYGCRKEEASFAAGRLNAPKLCLLESLGVRHVVVGALSAVEANAPKEEVVVCRSELSEVLLAGSPSHTPVHRDFITSVFRRRIFRVNGASSILYSSRLDRS